MKTRHILGLRTFVLSLFFFLITLFNGSFSQTVTKTYTAPSSVSIDGCGTYCSSLPGVTFTAADFPTACSITDVNVNIVWAKTDGTCTAPGTGSSFHSETSFRIDGPMGVNEILVQPSTYSGNGSTSATSTTFDQAAATIVGGVDPVSGTFRPNNGNLDNFNGTNGIGTWYLRAGDSGAGDPLCIVSYSVTLTMAGTLDNASFSYPSTNYCVNAVDPMPTITGQAGGTFSSTAGLAINATTGVIDVSASTPGSYSVTYTTPAPCSNSSSVSVAINALDNAGFSYAASSYCTNAADPTPTITGLPGGTFSSTAGLSINASTGTIDVSASTPGTYSVNYVTNGTCPNGTVVSVTINAADNAGFNYSASAYCVNAVDPTPTITGVAGGTFSSTAGLSINASTGAIDVSASTPGVYTVTYTTAGTCPNSSTASVTINALDNAGFNYSASAYCVNGVDPTPTITGVAGGTFSSTAGLSINTSTGAIDVSASTPGTYTVTYTTSGTCPNASNVSVTINTTDDAGFSYSAAAYCVSAVDPTPTITGLAGGTFSSTAGLSINASTGAIDVSASTPGVYTVTYTTAGTCPNSSTVSVTINALDNAGFNYSASAYCVNGVDPTPTITGVPGGTFSSTAGLSINTSTGVIDVSASTPGTYNVSYTTNGTCPNSSVVSVTINALDDAGFSYSAAAYCVNAADPTPTITGVAGGTFTSTAGLSINATTGLIDLSASTPGTYSVSYTTSGTCPNTSSVSVTINNVSTGTDTQVACNSYTWIDGITYTASNNTAMFTLTNAAGCDSVVTLNLTINTATTGTDTQVACDTYTWIDGITYTASNNVATYTLTNAAGCDSVVTLNLTINNATTGTDTQVACDAYTWIDGVTYTASNNVATYTLTNAAGCDSVVTLDLTINNATTGTDTQVACDTYTWIDGNTYTASNNTATFTLTNAAGCDSIVTLDLTVNYSASSSITEVSCGDYVSPGGNTYTTSGTYTEILTTGAGCDSTLTINLTVETIDVSVSVAGVTMTANYSGGTYQWINCATLSPIAGATGQSYTAVANGDYAVIVSSGNCSDTSACTTINSVKLTELELAELIKLYPNPAAESHVTIDYDGVISSVDVYDVMGRIMIKGVKPTDNKLDISSLSYGKYIVRITTESAVIMKELIIAR